MRLDNFLVDKNYFDSRTKAKQAIDRGEIFINGLQIKKPAFEVDDTAKIEYIFDSKFVSLGGYKLEKALKDFELSVSGLTVADIGSSTGGFTDCLLQNGAKKVFAVDLNDSLLHEKLKQDDRVSFIIKNAKYLTREDFRDNIDLIVADLSFISISQVISAFASIISAKSKALILVKPQFELGEHKKFKNGIVKDDALHKKICENIISLAENYCFKMLKMTTAPIHKDKNIEFLILFEKE